MNEIKNKRVLIIGGTGSLGHALVRYLYKNNELFIISRDETKQWEMQNKYSEYSINYYICDLRDLAMLTKAILSIKPNIIINASAMKQVPACEMFPYESVKTNIIGIQNLIQVCQEHYEPETVLGISTDKACKPVNVYGMCKAIGERMYIAANDKSSTKFLCVRYGNVMESRGSIIPFYKYHFRTDNEYPLTHKEMTRFFMTLDDSVKLIQAAITLGKKGDTFIPYVKSGKVEDLAKIFIQRAGKGKIKEIGIRPGEKIHEELINEEEIRRTYELNSSYLIVKPFISKTYPHYDLSYRTDPHSKLKKTRITRFSSDLFLFSKTELNKYLIDKKVFEKDSKNYDNEDVKF